MALNFEKYAQKGHEFVNHVAEELKTTDIDYVNSITRSVLRALRNRLTKEESFQLMAQLPMAIKAVYVDGWKFHSEYKRIKHLDDFLEEVLNEYDHLGFSKLTKPEHARSEVQAVFKTLARYVSADEIKDVIAVLPHELKKFLSESISA